MKRSMRILTLIPAGLLLGAAGLYAADAPNAKALYAAKCAMCHGKDMKGNPAMLKMLKVEPAAINLVDAETLAKKDDELILTTTKGKGKMPKQEGKLTPEEIQSLIAYIRASSPKAAEPSKSPSTAPAAAPAK